MTEKVPMPSSPPRAEAPANDAPTFPPIKVEAFDKAFDILEDQQSYFADSFEAGMELLREPYQVNIFSQ